MKKQKKQNTNKGITLIALVITIIVMLILVAVTITMAVNGGLFQYAQNAGRQTNEAIANEQQLANLEENMTVDELIDKYTQESEEEPTEVSVGDYVNYPVTYTNVGTYARLVGNDWYYPMDKYTGWRVLSKETDEDGNEYVRLVSAGVPLSFYHAADGNTTITNLTTNFLTTEIDSTALTSGKFHGCGFELGEGANNLSGVFTNQFTDRVQSLIKEDIEELVGETLAPGLPLYSTQYTDLIAVPLKPASASVTDPSYIEDAPYAAYYLASLSFDSYVWYVQLSGTPSQFMYLCLGVRPVVSLKSDVQFTLATEETNGTTTWDISIGQ